MKVADIISSHKLGQNLSKVPFRILFGRNLELWTRFWKRSVRAKETTSVYTNAKAAQLFSTVRAGRGWSDGKILLIRSCFEVENHFNHIIEEHGEVFHLDGR